MRFGFCASRPSLCLLSESSTWQNTEMFSAEGESTSFIFAIQLDTFYVLKPKKAVRAKFLKTGWCEDRLGATWVWIGPGLCSLVGRWTFCAVPRFVFGFPRTLASISQKYSPLDFDILAPSMRASHPDHPKIALWGRCLPSPVFSSGSSTLVRIKFHKYFLSSRLYKMYKMTTLL